MSSDLIEQRAMLAEDDQEFPPPLPKRDYLEPVFSVHPEPSILRQLLSAPPTVPPHQPHFFQPGPQATVTQDQYAPYTVPFNAFPQYNYPNFVDFQQQGFPQFSQFGYDFHTNYNIPYGFNGFPTQPIPQCPVENVKETRKRKATEDSVTHNSPAPQLSKLSLIYLALLNANNHTGKITTIVQFLRTNFYSFDGNVATWIRNNLEKSDLIEKIKAGIRDVSYRLIDPAAAIAKIQSEISRKNFSTVGMKFPEVFSNLFHNTSAPQEEVSLLNSVQSESVVHQQELVIENEPDFDFLDTCFEQFGQPQHEVVSVKSVEPEAKKHKLEIMMEKQSFDFDFVDPVFPYIESNLVEFCDNQSDLVKLCSEATIENEEKFHSCIDIFGDDEDDDKVFTSEFASYSNLFM